MRLIKETNIDFMAARKPAMIVSIILLIVAVSSLATRGLDFGIDFTGGYLIEVGYAEPVELAPIRQLLEDNGVPDATVQHFGARDDVMVRMAPRDGGESEENAAQISDEILAILKKGDTDVSMRRVEFVGPQVGEELKNQGGLALLAALICVMVYVMLRFEKRFSLGAVLALVHDVIITLGVFAVIQADFDLTVLAAVLAVIGYSLNDTIVVYDRIRENFRRMRKASPKEITNVSVNQMLSRTLMTSLTTLLVLFSLFFLGGEIIHSFALALIIGVVIGTYSSVFVASPIVLALGLRREDMLPVKKEGEELESP
jgi:preprotein translocase subunit SecF